MQRDGTVGGSGELTKTGKGQPRNEFDEEDDTWLVKTGGMRGPGFWTRKRCREYLASSILERPPPRSYAMCCVHRQRRQPHLELRSH